MPTTAPATTTPTSNRAHLKFESVEVEALAPSEPDAAGVSRKRFRMVANTGVPFQRYGEQFVVDLESMNVSKQKKPVLLQHDPDRRVGWTESIALTERGLEITGVVAQSTPEGRQVSAELAEGFPYESSISVDSFEVERVGAKDTVSVNGHQLEGPGYVLRGGNFREVSFVSLGADPLTEAEMLQLEGTTMPKPTGTAEAVAPDEASSADTSTSENLAPQPVDAIELLELARDEQIGLAKELLKRGVTRDEALIELFNDLSERYEQLAAESAKQNEEVEKRVDQARRTERLAAVRDGSTSLGADDTEVESPEVKARRKWDSMSLMQRGEFYDSFEMFLEREGQVQ